MNKLPDNKNLDTICIALTANAVAGAREMYIEVGFADYLAKPINAQKLEQMLCDNLPKEKLIFEGDERFNEAETANKTLSPEEEKLRTLQGIDVDEAIKNAGDAETLINVIEDFKENIQDKLDKIREYEQNGDIKNYTIQVHSLKSSARIIGAMELSDLARDLEESGNSGDTARIKEKTPRLLEILESYKEKLSFGDETQEKSNSESVPEAKAKKTISKDELEAAYGDIKELMQVFDYDNANGIFNMLSDYDIPEDLRSKHEELRKAMAQVDREKVLELL